MVHNVWKSTNWQTPLGWSHATESPSDVSVGALMKWEVTIPECSRTLGPVSRRCLSDKVLFLLWKPFWFSTKIQRRACRPEMFSQLSLAPDVCRGGEKRRKLTPFNNVCGELLTKQRGCRNSLQFIEGILPPSTREVKKNINQSCFFYLSAAHISCVFLFLFITQTVEHGFPHQPSALAFDPKLQLMAIGTKSGAIKVYPFLSGVYNLLVVTLKGSTVTD